MALTQTQVSELYVSIFGRASEGTGNEFWQAEDSMESAAAAMLATDPAIEYFGETLNDNQAFIEFIYENTFGKTYAEDPEGVDFWTAALDGGTSKAKIVADMIGAVEGVEDGNAAKAQFNNRVEVSNYTADTIAEAGDNLDQFKNYINTVTDDAATVTSAKESVQADRPENPGKTFTLTDDINTITGTSGDDVVIGDNQTASLADTLDMGAGLDTVKLYGTGTLPTLNSVEAVEFINANAALDTTNQTSLETVLLKNTVLDNGPGVQNITLANGEALTFENVDANAANDGAAVSTTNAEETFKVNDVAGASGATRFDLDLSTNQNETVTTLTLEGQTNKSAINLVDNGDDLATLNITGDATVEVTNGGITSLETIDASAAEAAADITVNAAVDATITGSAQDDTITMAAAELNEDDTLDGGEGADTLEITNTGTDSVAGDLNLSNIETLKLNTDINGGGASVDLDKVTGITSVVMAGTNTNTDDDASYTLTDITTDATSLTFSGDGDDLDQAFDGVVMDYDTTTAIASATVDINNGGTEAKDVEIQEISLANVESITINAADVGTASGEALTVNSALDASEAVDITIASNSDVVLTGGITGSDDLETIDTTGSDAGVNLGTISNISDGFALEMGDGNDTVTITNADGDELAINLGAGNDQLTLTQTGDQADSVITLGEGADVVNFTNSVNHGTIQDFTAGTGGDVLAGLSNAATVANPTTFVSDTDGGTITNGFTTIGSANAPTDLTATNIATFLDTAGNFGGTAFDYTASQADVFYLAVDNNNDTAIVEVTAANDTDTNFSGSATLQVIGILNDVDDATDLTAANFNEFLG